MPDLFIHLLQAAFDAFIETMNRIAELLNNLKIYIMVKYEWKSDRK